MDAAMDFMFGTGRLLQATLGTVIGYDTVVSLPVTFIKWLVLLACMYIGYQLRRRESKTRYWFFALATIVIIPVSIRIGYWLFSMVTKVALALLIPVTPYFFQEWFKGWYRVSYFLKDYNPARDDMFSHWSDAELYWHFSLIFGVIEIFFIIIPLTARIVVPWAAWGIRKIKQVINLWVEGQDAQDTGSHSQCDEYGQPIKAQGDMIGRGRICPNPACGDHLVVPSEPVATVSEESAQSDDIEFPCPFCRHQLVVDKRGAGLVVACPECGEQIVIPVRASQTEPALALLGRDLPEGILAEEEHDSGQERGSRSYADERTLPAPSSLACPTCFKTEVQRPYSWKSFSACLYLLILYSIYLPIIGFLLHRQFPASIAENLSYLPVLLLFITLLGLAFNIKAGDNKCNGCGHRWKSKGVSCPKCSDTDVRRPQGWGAFALIGGGMLLFSMPLALIPERNLNPALAMLCHIMCGLAPLALFWAYLSALLGTSCCNACGHRWNEESARGGLAFFSTGVLFVVPFLTLFSINWTGKVVGSAGADQDIVFLFVFETVGDIVAVVFGVCVGFMMLGKGALTALTAKAYLVGVLLWALLKLVFPYVAKPYESYRAVSESYVFSDSMAFEWWMKAVAAIMAVTFWLVYFKVSKRVKVAFPEG